MRIKNYFLLLLFLSFTCLFNSLKLQATISKSLITCDDVTQITVPILSLNSATINWVSGTTGNSWDVVVGLATVFDPNILAFTNATTPSLLVDNLTAGATYKVWVRSNCDVGGTGNWVGPVLFTTNCLPVSTFYESFDTTVTPSLPLCWSKIIRGDNVSVGAKIQTASYNASSTPNAVEITNWASTGEYDLILVSPNLANLSNGTHRLRFTTKGVATLEIGTLDANTNSGVFSAIDEVISTSITTEHVISFDSYTGSDTFVGIRLAASAPNNYIFLDNLVWEAIPSCDDVTNVVATSTTANSANFIWTPGVETSWDVAIGAATVTDPYTLPYQTVLYENITSASYFNATNLESLTTYKMWVRAVCVGEGNGAWIGPVIFTTNCPPMTDFNENFDTTANTFLPTCWSKILRGTGLSANAKVEVANNPIFEAKSVSLSNHTSTGNYDVILVSPQVSNISMADHHLRFFAKFASTFEVGTLNSNTNAAVFTLFETVTTVNGLAEYIVDFSSYTGTDQYIGIRLRDNEPSYTFVTLDNMVWEAIPDCPEITNINVPSVTTESAEINWNSTPIETSWEIVYSATSVTDPNTLTPIPTSNIPYDLTGLSASTTYKVWVRAVCENSNGVWIGPIQFTTECPPVATFIENFDSVALPNLPLCWSKILRGPSLSQFAFIDTYSSNVASFPNFTAPNYVNLNPQGSQPTAEIVLVSPKVSTLSLGTHRLKFDTYYPGSIQVGTLNGNTATAVFTPLQTVESGGFTGSSQVINFTSYTGSDTYIGIRVIPDPNTFPSINLDNITWEPIPACPDVTQISVASTSQTGATFNWTTGGTEQSWQVAVGEATVADPNTLSAQSASATTLSVTGLIAATNYKVWVRSICTNDNGAWIGPVLFLTPCIAVDVPYTENFQTASPPNLPECTSSEIASVGSNNWVTHTGATNFGFPSKALRYYDSMENANAWFFTRAINLVQGQNYTISYKKGSNSNFSWMGCNLKVMYGTSPYSTAMTTIIANHTDFYGPGVFETIPFTVSETGVYYFSFNVYSPANASSVFLDDIVIQENLSTNTNDYNQLSFYPNPVTDYLTISSNNNITSIVLYNLLGQKVTTNNIEGHEVKIDMSALSAGTYIAKITANSSIKTVKVIKQ
ncbi:T9SS type A sorting domain-containing protein [Flavobacterium sp. SM2513]|uniref:T9SS type A sorting domain-containing protein n=1 Tax=Flavobacterium sp. SM2513 TaxID=3424766 RepID=UPI003D7F6F38